MVASTGWVVEDESTTVALSYSLEERYKGKWKEKREERNCREMRKWREERVKATAVVFGVRCCSGSM